jgi:IS1 family transposase
MKDHIWTSSGTDITIRWRLTGWVPPSEVQEYRDKWKYYQNLPLRKLDDQAKEQYEQVLRRAKVARIK